MPDSIIVLSQARIYGSNQKSRGQITENLNINVKSTQIQGLLEIFQVKYNGIQIEN